MVNFHPFVIVFFAHLFLIVREHQNQQIFFLCEIFVMFEDVLWSFCFYDLILKNRRIDFAYEGATRQTDVFFWYSPRPKFIVIVLFEKVRLLARKN